MIPSGELMRLTTRWNRSIIWMIISLSTIVSMFWVDKGWITLSMALFLLLAIYLAYIELMVGAIFISPRKSKLSVEGEIWDSHHVEFKSLKSHIISSSINGKAAPTVVFIHGWRSTSLSVVGRAEWFIERGWNAVIFELIGHGKSSTIDLWNAISASEHIEHHMMNLDQFIDLSQSRDVFLYGHSIGGYIASRISSENSRVTNQTWTGVILESPLMLYSMIFDEIVQALRIQKILRKQLLRRVYREVVRMHPKIMIDDSLKQFDVPQWGLPLVPTLCLQASEDNRLGRVHYDALYEHANHSQTRFHLIDSLPHSGAKRNDEREKLLSEWLNGFDSLLLK